jgi:tRNA (guanine37-N1)-methyltransferase
VRIAVATLFPGLFEDFLGQGVVGRAVTSGIVGVDILDIRRHAVDQRGSVDDYQFGGGAGMLMRPEPLFETLAEVRWPCPRVVLMTPDGRRLDQDLVRELALSGGMAVFCGRYGGVDARFVERAVTDEVSIGDYVLSGGELPAMVLIEAVLRWVPGVLGRMESAESDSFATGLLDHPRYTRPASYDGMEVPGVLLSGNHAEVAEWRFRRALERTMERRPDLLEGVPPADVRKRFMDAVLGAARNGKERSDG